MTDETTQLPVDQFIEDVIAAFRNEFNCVIVNDEPMNSGEILNEPIENFLINKLSLLQAKHTQELREAWNVAKKHGTLPDPHPYGETVSIRRHNQVIQEMEDIFFGSLSHQKTKEM